MLEQDHSTRPGSITGSLLSSQVQLPDSVDPGFEFVEEDPDCKLKCVTLPIDSTENQSFSSMLSRAVNDVVYSIPRIAINSWKNNVMSAIRTKFNHPPTVS